MRYIVVDEDDHLHERVRLTHEGTTSDENDREFYATRLRQAAASILTPVGWRRQDIETYLADRTDAPLSVFE